VKVWMARVRAVVPAGICRVASRIDDHSAAACSFSRVACGEARRWIAPLRRIRFVVPRPPSLAHESYRSLPLTPRSTTDRSVSLVRRPVVPRCGVQCRRSVQPTDRSREGAASKQAREEGRVDVNTRRRVDVEERTPAQEENGTNAAMAGKTQLSVTSALFANPIRFHRHTESRQGESADRNTNTR
jgi:hypothetical protein